MLSPGEDQLFKKYTNIINNKLSTPEEKQYAKRMLNYLLSSIEKDCKTNLYKNKSLYELYKTEKAEYIGQYKKHILILKATQIFFPEVEAQNVINVKNHVCDVQYIKTKSKKQEKIAILETKINQNNKNAQRYSEKIQKLNISIEKDTQQNQKWKSQNYSRIVKYYMWKAKLHGDKEKVRDRYLNKAEKLNISTEQKNLLINWINDSYSESIQKRGE